MNNTPLILAMCQYEKDCVRRINHFLKVFSFAKAIGDGESLNDGTKEILEAAALVHDIGIKPSLEKYGSSAGEYQEKEGPEIAREMLRKLHYDEKIIERVCFLIGHHHTYKNIEGEDYQILVEADFLVNIFEGEMEKPAIEEVKSRIFRTETGKKLLDIMYLS